MNEDSTNVSRMNLHELAQLALSSLTFTSAEERLFKGAEQGDPIVFTSSDCEQDNPGNAGSWGKDRTIRAECIEWLCYDKQAQDRIHPRGIRIEGAKISKPLKLSFARVPFPLALAKCAFTDTMAVRYARIRALDLHGSHVESIFADGLNVDSDFFLSSGFKTEGEVRLPGATVGGGLDCNGGEFINKEGIVLIADGAQITGSVFLSDGFKAEGEVRLPGATIGGYLDCSGGQFINKGGKALNADGGHINGDFFLRNGFKAEGAVRLLGATIGGDLDCSKGQFINKKGQALSADRAQINGNVFLNDGFKAEGEVRLPGATIGGDLDCSKGQFINKGGKALSADSAQINGSVFLRNGFKAEGGVSLVGAIVEGWLIWINVLNRDETTMDLRGGHVDTLWDDSNSWPKSSNLYLHGFCYDEIDDDAPVDAKQRIEWLQLQPSGHFYPQPYEHLAAVLCAKGHENAAKNVQIAKNVDRRRRGTITPIAKPFHWLLGLLTGYGYHTWRPLLVGLLLVGIGWGLFHGGARAGVIMRVEGDEFVPVDEAVSLVQLHFHPLLYSFDIFLPVISFGHADLWAPNEAMKGPLLNVGGHVIPISGLVLCCYKWGLNVLGWVLTTLFIAGLTGIIRRRV